MKPILLISSIFLTVMRIVIVGIYLINNILGTEFSVKPLAYVLHKSNGGTWHTNKTGPVTIFGLGIHADATLDQWTIEGEFIFNSVSGLTTDPYAFSPEQGIEFVRKYRESEGFWYEYSTLKATWTTESVQLNFGKFTRHWGPGTNALLISGKAPSYPQFGFDWTITPDLSFSYFHGFLKSGVFDSSRAQYYREIKTKLFDISRSIAAHRLEWKPTNRLILGASETVIYAVRPLEVTYLLPFIPFWSAQHYLGDIDNVQMCGDITLLLDHKRKFYTSLFIDEWRPEWTLKERNRNWVAWQMGLFWPKLITSTDQLSIEWTWTDHRVYRHRYAINASYSHGYPLGFWAGPHAEELVSVYKTTILNSEIILRYSDTKRGPLTDNMLEDQYNDVKYKRFSGLVNFERLRNLEVIIQRYLFGNKIMAELGIEYVWWDNAGFDPYNPDPDSVKDIRKTSLRIGFFYDFSQNNPPHSPGFRYLKKKLHQE